MTIQFHCPYCTAAIEVDDAAGGKVGRCPKCGSRLNVPRPAGSPPAAASEPIPSSAESDVYVANATAVPPAEPVVDVAVSAPGALPDPTRSSLPVGAVSRRVKRRARRRGGWWIPALFGLIFVGAVGWLAFPQWEWDGLSGSIPGEALADVELDPATVSCAGVRLPQRQVAGLLLDLEREPINLSSDLMLVQIRGHENGLSLSVGPSRKTSWYRIDPRSHLRLAKYLAQEGPKLEEARSRDLALALEDFLDLRIRLQSDASPAGEVGAYRDRLAIPGLVQGVGHHVAARVGNELYPCVRETADGQLYFLLPRGLKEFDLIGRKLPQGTTAFPGEFVVNVKETVEPASEAPIEVSAPEPAQSEALAPAMSTENKPE